jgi:hypothetical protein
MGFFLERGVLRYFICRVTCEHKSENAARTGAADSAALVDVHRYQAIHKMALAHGAAIGGKQREHRLGWGSFSHLLGGFLAAGNGLR